VSVSAFDSSDQGGEEFSGERANYFGPYFCPLIM
jgi:hypothetical protein